MSVKPAQLFRELVIVEIVDSTDSSGMYVASLRYASGDVVVAVECGVNTEECVETNCTIEVTL